jgi:hypothetical protein
LGPKIRVLEHHDHLSLFACDHADRLRIGFSCTGTLGAGDLRQRKGSDGASCAAKFTDDGYFCIDVRCEASKVLGLYFANPGPGMPSPFRISIDGREHMITMSIKPN